MSIHKTPEHDPQRQENAPHYTAVDMQAEATKIREARERKQNPQGMKSKKQTMPNQKTQGLGIKPMHYLPSTGYTAVDVQAEGAKIREARERRQRREELQNKETEISTTKPDQQETATENVAKQPLQIESEQSKVSHKSETKKPSEKESKVTISKGFMMLTSEGSFGDDIYTVKRPHWPGDNSGVTIGFGFDIGAAFPSNQAGKAKTTMIKAGIDPGTASTLAKYVGIKGNAAQAPALKLRKEGISITIPQALKLLEVSHKIFNDAVHQYTSVDSNQVHPALEEVFTDLAYAWWNFKYTEEIYNKVKDKPDTEQFEIAAKYIEAKLKAYPGNELFQMIKNYLNGIKGYLKQGKEVEVSREIMTVKQLLASKTLRMMDVTTKGVGYRENKGSITKAILTGQRFNPAPTPAPQVTQVKVSELSRTPLPNAYHGFSVGRPSGKYTEELMNYTQDVQRIQQKLLAVGLLSEASFTKEYPKTPVPLRPDYPTIELIATKNTLETPNTTPHVLKAQQQQKEAEEQAQQQQQREKLLHWLQELNEEEVRAIAENPALNTPFAQLVIQSGIGGITTKVEMIERLMTWRGQQVAPLTSKDTPSLKSNTSDLIKPEFFVLSEFEQRAMSVYGKVPAIIGFNRSTKQLTQTIAAIEVFQREIKGGIVDGRIDPNGKTLGLLMAATKESVAAARKAYALRKKQEEENQKKETEEQKKERAKEIIKGLEKEVVEEVQDFIKYLDTSLLVTFLRILVDVKHKQPKQKKQNIKNAVLADLMKKNELVPKEIAIARRLIEEEKDVKKKGDFYQKLSAKVKYANQRDNDSMGYYKKRYCKIGDIMCNVTSMAMGFEFLGISNPDKSKQFEDSLEKIRSTNKYASRETFAGQGSIAKHLGVNYIQLASSYGQRDKSWYIKNVLPLVRSGKSVILGVIYGRSFGHIVRLQDVNEKGLIVDDPFGKINLKTKSFYGLYNNFTTSNSRDKNSKKYSQGDNNLWSWDDIKKGTVIISWVRYMSKKQ